MLNDIGVKSSAYCSLTEMALTKPDKPELVFSIGDTCEFVVMSREDENGQLMLSRRRILYQEAWDHVAQLYADEKRDGYELQATPSGTAVLVPTGNRAISIEAPPEDAPGVSLPPGLSPKQPSPNAPKAKAEGEGAAPVSLPPGLGVKSPGA